MRQTFWDPQRRLAVRPGQALRIQVFSASSGGYRLAAAVLEGTPPRCRPPPAFRVLRLFLKWGHPSTSSSQTPFLGTHEPSDLGWAGLGRAGVDFGSGVGFPEQIYGTGRVAKRQLNLPQGRASKGVLIPEGHPDPELAKPWPMHRPVKAEP